MDVVPVVPVELAVSVSADSFVSIAELLLFVAFPVVVAVVLLVVASPPAAFTPSSDAVTSTSPSFRVIIAPSSPS
ncbi:hypothetical protein D3C74_420830 [compost metagenome]